MREPEWSVRGVIELNCWIAHVPHYQPTGRDAEECVDAHARCGITHLVWELGRSVLTYHSNLPGVTHRWDRRRVGGEGQMADVLSILCVLSVRG